MLSQLLSAAISVSRDTSITRRALARTDAASMTLRGLIVPEKDPEEENLLLAFESMANHEDALISDRIDG